MWGKIAGKLRVEYALYAAALWLILSVYLSIPFPLRNIDIGIFKLPEISPVVLPTL